MTLFDAGQAPPARLSGYAWRVGAGRVAPALDLRTWASTDRESGGAKQPEIPLPPVHVRPRHRSARAVSPAGDLTYAWHVSNTAVVADVQTPQGVVDGMRAEVAAIEHLRGPLS